MSRRGFGAASLIRASLDRVERLESRMLLSTSIELERIGSFRTGGFGVGAAEISAYDRETRRLFVVNAQASTVDILDLRDPARIRRIDTIDVSSLGSPNSVAVGENIIAVAIQAQDKTQPGMVGLYKTNGQFINAVKVGALPDMLTFSPDGRFVLVANEGEPNSYNQADSVDPEGSVSIIPVPKGIGNVRKLEDSDVLTASFRAFNGQESQLRSQGIRIYGPGATAAQDFEPEYITIGDDSSTAYVTLQENNAIAVIDIETAAVKKVLPLGFKQWSASALDASDRDGAINIRSWPVLGMFEPDAIASYEVGGETFIVTANEGDARDYTGFAEEARIGSLNLDAVAFPDGAQLKMAGNLGRLNVTRSLGDTDGDGDFDELYTLGGRSFSIRNADGTLVYDSGDDFERITADAFPSFFNVSNDDNVFDSRSDNKGPEPEGLDLGVIDGRTYAFIGLERISGVMVYDVTNPQAPRFVQYTNPRDFSVDVRSELAGDLGPEGILFIPGSDSPTGEPLLVTANEVSGTVSVFSLASVSAGESEALDESGSDGLHTQRASWPGFAVKASNGVFGESHEVLA